MRVLVVEPYHGGSHAAWAEGYQRASGHEVVLVTHEAAFWRWRLRGGALTLADEVRAAVAGHGRPDVLLVSGMVHLAALLGFLRRDLGDVPVGLYLHENQLTHPVGPQDRSDESFPLANWLSMAVAERVFVNSRSHLDDLAAALPALLDRAPDRAHLDHLDAVLARCEVLPVGVDLTGLTPDGHEAPAAPLIVWNQRWDHEKRPRRLFRALRTLHDEGVPFRLALAGDNTRVDPQEFARIRADLGDRVVHVGALRGDTYRALLRSGDVVVSCADHETFGVATVEAVAAGCVPLLPRRLSYPEIVADRWHDTVLYDDGTLVDRLRSVLTDLPAARRAVGDLAPSMQRFDWSVVAPAYDDRLRSLAA